jgi:hypothetical protein
LVIHDTFSIDKKNRDILIKQIGIARMHRMHIDFLKKKLVELGFKKVEVKKVYSYKHYEWQDQNMPKVSSHKGETSIYDSPLNPKTTDNVYFSNEWGLTEFGKFIYVRNYGWVNKNTVIVKNRRRTLFKKLVKFIFPDIIFHFWHSKKNLEKGTVELVVKASR